jgi:hypothetical protein
MPGVSALGGWLYYMQLFKTYIHRDNQRADNNSEELSTFRSSSKLQLSAVGAQWA